MNGKSILVNVINGLSPVTNLKSASEEMTGKRIFVLLLGAADYTFLNCCFTREKFVYNTKKLIIEW